MISLRKCLISVETFRLGSNRNKNGRDFQNLTTDWKFKKVFKIFHNLRAEKDLASEP